MNTLSEIQELTDAGRKPLAVTLAVVPAWPIVFDRDFKFYDFRSLHNHLKVVPFDRRLESYDLSGVKGRGRGGYLFGGQFLPIVKPAPVGIEVTTRNWSESFGFQPETPLPAHRHG